MLHHRFLPILFLLLLILLILIPLQQDTPPRLILATTTSAENSGLLEVLLPPFEEETGISVHVVAVGTGKALEMGRRGDAHLLLVHAQEAEEEFIQEEPRRERHPLMFNYFVLLGPRDDPAQVENSCILQALRTIHQQELPFIARGDGSGTDIKERSLWEKLQLLVEDKDWYLITGQGMGASLVIASEKQAYILSDKGSFLAYQERVDLQILIEKEESRLENRYSIITLKEEKKDDMVQQLVTYLASQKAQSIINDFTIEGERAFFTTKTK